MRDLKEQLLRLSELTNKPFAVNHLLTTLNHEAFDLTLAFKPPVISFAGGDPGDLVKQAHDIGALVIHQVQTVCQARQAAERGVDAIIAQGGEAGGHSGTVAALALIPQVVDAVHPISVLAAGGIADGRGLAAALVLGAQGVNVGTRFLASVEAPISMGWKQVIVDAESEDAIKFDAWNDINPMPRVSEQGAVLRVIRTPFVDKWQHNRAGAVGMAAQLRGEVAAAARQGRLHEVLPIAGQSAGLIHEILPAKEIVLRMIAEANKILSPPCRWARRSPKRYMASFSRFWRFDTQ
jgi:nitronate monooxygenase/enoyl-[acyl-carrier protein] reductase II